MSTRKGVALRAAKGLAVLHVAMTGYRNRKAERAVEISSILLGPKGESTREFETILNPCRDVGDSGFHGVTASSARIAPLFNEIASDFLGAIDGCSAIAGYDGERLIVGLEAEFDRLPATLPPLPVECIKQMHSGESLSSICRCHSLRPPRRGARSIEFARCIASVLRAVFTADQFEDFAARDPVAWPALDPSSRQPLSRAEAERRLALAPPCLDRLGAKWCEFDDNNADVACIAYTALLHRALVDLVIDPKEASDLSAVASGLGMSEESTRTARLAYLRHLIAVALVDGQVVSAEREDLLRIGTLLGLPGAEVVEAISGAESRICAVMSSPASPAIAVLGSGTTVCFTGTSVCSYQGRKLKEPDQRRLAEAHGLVVHDNLSKKETDVLVAADLCSQSGKMKNATRWGKQVLEERAFWMMLGVDVE